MKTVVFGILMTVFWGAFYTVLPLLTDEKLVVVLFVANLVISMTVAAIVMAKQK